jgi:hypothetical protein
MERIDLAAGLLGAGSIAWLTHRLSSERNRRYDAEARTRELEYEAFLHEARDSAARDTPLLAAALDTSAAGASPRNASTGSSRPGIGRRAPAIARTFDRLFAQHGAGLPVIFLRALAYGESRLNPRADNGHAAGLLQIEHVVRVDHNRRHGTAYTRQDLFDPAINIQIAASALRTIIASYGRRHAALRNMMEDWDNYRFVELLAQGWNAGWSDAAGVGRVAHHLAAMGATTITVELVHQHAIAAGATRHLLEPRRLAWAKGIARHYAQERAREFSDALASGAVADRMPSRSDVIEMPPEIIERPPAAPDVIEMPPEIIERAPVVAVNDDASPVSMPSQVDPSPAHAAAPPPGPAPSPSPLLDPYAPAAPLS